MYVPGELGTKTAQGTYRNEVQVLDTGTMVWNAPNVEGDEAPHPRSDSDLVYDAKGSRIFLFGGWANRWFDDLYILDVGSVVGPPYAIMGIKPKIGPITGGQEISIEGLDFVQSNDVVIRFSSRAKGGQMEVAGEFVSSTLVKCISPDFMDIGSGEVEVRVSLNGDSYTTTYQKYNFFAVTDAEKCICFGPGIISGGAPQVETVFVIQAVDATGIFRETGGDVFDIVVRSSATAATVREVFDDACLVGVGGTRCVTRCVTSSTDNIMNMHARITVKVECIREPVFCLMFVLYLMFEYKDEYGSILTFFSI